MVCHKVREPMPNNQLPLPSQETMKNAILEGLIIGIGHAIITTIGLIILSQVGLRKEE